MSGFSADWLALREPVDHRSRSRDLAEALARGFAGRDTLRVVDLGAGTGSNLRALAPLLPPKQAWRLVDEDLGLLDEAVRRLAAWADAAERSGDTLRLTKDGRDIDVEFRSCDLATAVEAVIPADCDLMTASAFFDLSSASWMEGLVAAVTARRATLFAALTYDGRDAFTPAHPLDAAVGAAFARHMRRDKGFGIAAGPEAGAVLSAAARSAGYEVSERSSAWVLGAAEADLGRLLLAGMADAVAETEAVARADLDAWAAARAAACGEPDARIVCGHVDLLAHPPVRAASASSRRP